MNYNLSNPMSSFFNTASNLQSLKSNSMNLQQQQNEMEAAKVQAEQQALTQQRVSEIMPLVKSGDYDATIELATLDPNMSEAINKAKANLSEGQDREMINWLTQYQSAPDKAAFLQQDNPNLTVDDNFRGMSEEQRDVMARIVGAQLMPKEMFNAAFGKQEQISPYEQAKLEGENQDRDLRRQEIELRRLESEQKRAKTSQEQEAKSQQIEQKRKEVDEAKAQDKTRIDNGINTATQNKQVIDDLLNNDDYMSSLTGYTGRIPAVTTTGVEAEAYLDNIKNSMTIDNLGVMSGPLTDKDIQIIASASSRLRSGMSETALKKELNTIKKAYDRVVSNYQKESNRKGYKQESENLSDAQLLDMY